MTYPNQPQDPYQPGVPMQPLPDYPQGSPPSGGTAITAGVLAILGGLYAGWQAVSMFMLGAMLNSDMFAEELTQREREVFDAAMPEWIGAAGTVGGVLQVVIAALLAGGGVALLMKKNTGRWMVAAGCAAVLATSVVAYFVVANVMSSLGDAANAGMASEADVAPLTGMMNAFVAIGLLIVSLPAIVTLVLALVPPTARWCAYGKVGAPHGGQPPFGASSQPHPGQAPPQW